MRNLTYYEVTRKLDGRLVSKKLTFDFETARQLAADFASRGFTVPPKTGITVEITRMKTEKGVIAV